MRKTERERERFEETERAEREESCEEKMVRWETRKYVGAVAAAWLHGVRRSCARNGGAGRVRVGVKERIKSLHVRGPSCSSTCVTQFRNFSSLGNVGRKNRV